ncbi:hypothetical protein F4604DRAFT_1916351 [Suillus subluteus]|nr:hypothetical protein F4604DRAFT_1916351 [Suillus subluteus]
MPAIELIILPKLGQKYAPDKALEEEHFAVHTNTTKAVIKTRVMGCGLPSSGTQVILLDRLQNFSANKDEWLSLFEPTKKRKRGSQFGGEDTNVTLYQSKKGVDRVQRTLQDSDRQANSAWAQAVVACFGINTDLRPVHRAASTLHIAGKNQGNDPRSTKATVALHGDSEEDTLALTHYVRRFQRNLFNHVDEVEDKIDQVLHLHTSTSPSVPPETATAPIPPQHQHELNPAAAHIAPLLDTTVHTVPREDIPVVNLKVAHLGNKDFTYDKSQLRGPPLIHFSRDIERLCSEWESSDLPIVNGRGIPIKYWGEFFKKSKTRSENSA